MTIILPRFLEKGGLCIYLKQVRATKDLADAPKSELDVGDYRYLRRVTMQAANAESTPEHVVILGGGFGGLYVAKALACRLELRHRITLVDRVDHMLYTPMLTEVAGGTVRPVDIAVPLASLPKRVQFVKAEVSAVDANAKLVTLADGRTLEATQLVFALGSSTNYHDIPGARENSFSFKTLADAEAVLKRLDEMIARAAACPDAQERQSILTIAVAGGGYTGVETMAAVSGHLRQKVGAAGISADEVKLVLIEPSERLMHETAAPLAAYSQAELERNGIKVALHTAVKEVDGDTVHLSDGTSHKAGLLIWDTGIVPSPLLESVQVPKGKHHGVRTDSCFRVEAMPGLWAIGDCAEIPQANGKTFAPTAQNATREGTHLAQNINAVLRGRAARSFQYTMVGQLALVGERKGVAEVFGVEIRGLAAWAMWWMIYIAKLPYMTGRFGVVRSLLAGQAVPARTPQQNKMSHRGAIASKALTASSTS